MQLWHGTEDNLLRYQNLIETNKQWSNVLSVPYTTDKPDTPKRGYTRTTFYNDGSDWIADASEEEYHADEVVMVSYRAEGVGHTVPELCEDIFSFFGLM